MYATAILGATAQTRIGRPPRLGTGALQSFHGSGRQTMVVNRQARVHQRPRYDSVVPGTGVPHKQRSIVSGSVDRLADRDATQFTPPKSPDCSTAILDTDQDVPLAHLGPEHRADFIRAWLLRHRGGLGSSATSFCAGRRVGCHHRDRSRLPRFRGTRWDSSRSLATAGAHARQRYGVMLANEVDE